MTKQTIHYKYLKDGKKAFKDVVRSVVFEEWRELTSLLVQLFMIIGKSQELMINQ